MHSFALVKLYRRVQTFYKDVPHVGCSVGTTGPTSFPYGGRKRCTKPRLNLLCQLGQGFSVCLCISGACSVLLSVQPCTVVTELAGSVNLGDVITALALLFSLVTVSVSQ